ncbi:TIGR01212 family radical SAM protein [Carboxydothermus hydrogenoformans]|uniref:Radical SAM protein, TIGR01212 family n=1 Tax=Carboxydothermus hydrogenoformans (strain ATCC BAA-161 / DSM 6008 / Z-2901) TaxID=246194 RepID=Q3ADN2_CARHZ|nr:TIGR01212 family radical SAM protein [Carboxydothermus hydrogenoformans]ABB14122.1 radical SAM protein, TIGR01212 family [Carboxydothermus hydrogenoformans Z-2901]
MERYYSYTRYLKEKFGGKVYKIPVNLPHTCPNRDGTVGTGGCIFCEDSPGGFVCLPDTRAISQKVEELKKYFQDKFKAQKFIVYFQAYTNTYHPLAVFRDYILAAVDNTDIVGLSVSTRPDAVNDKYLEVLAEVKNKKNIEVDVELGLQTVNYKNLIAINRGHTLAEFIDAVLRIKKFGLNVTTHLILNLPGETLVDVIENAKIMSALKIDFVKLHTLFIPEKTVLGDMYREGKIEIIPLEEYVQWVVTFLEYLSPEVVVQRLIGKGPDEGILFSNWGVSWWKIKHLIEEELEKRDTRQGAKCDYLNGKAVQKFLS